VATVWVPSLLRTWTGGQSQVQAAGATLGQVIASVERQFPGFAERVCTQDGDLHAGIGAAIDGALATEGRRARVNADSEVVLLAAISGG
jgi:molybdopterin converting factor small subunit